MGAEGKTFHEFVDNNGLFWSLKVGVNSHNPQRWKKVGENVYVWRPGQDGEQEYDFTPFFPMTTDDGTPRAEVDRREGYLFALYEHRGGTGEFVPFGDED